MTTVGCRGGGGGGGGLKHFYNFTLGLSSQPSEIMCFTVMFHTDELEDPYADRTYMFCYLQLHQNSG